MKSQTEFLKNIGKIGNAFSSIYENGDLVPLFFSFWKWGEINDSMKLRSEWEVNENQIPFYGDWHDIFCIDTASGHIIHLDDQRNIVAEWQSIENFIESLSTEEVNTGKTREIDESKTWLNF